MLNWRNLICSAVEHSPEGRGQRGCERKVTSGQHSTDQALASRRTICAQSAAGS